MTDVLDKTDKQGALDTFAAMQPASLPPPRELSTVAERIVGAQSVAVYRDEARVLAKLKALAAAAGSDWYYRFPVKNRKTGQTDWIEGPSIKLANDLARFYGNCEVDTRVIDLGDSWLIYARFSDFETGYSLTRPYQQYKDASRLGGGDDSRRKDIAFQIGTSKAIRNVTVNALQTFADFAFEEAKGALVDRIGKDLPGWRTKIVTRTVELGIDVRRVEHVMGRAAADWLAPDMARIIAMMKSVNDGMATLDETFPPVEPVDARPPTTPPPSAKLDEFAKKEEPKAESELPDGLNRKKKEAAKQKAAAEERQIADGMTPDQLCEALLERITEQASANDLTQWQAEAQPEINLLPPALKSRVVEAIAKAWEGLM